MALATLILFIVENTKSIRESIGSFHESVYVTNLVLWANKGYFHRSIYQIKLFSESKMPFFKDRGHKRTDLNELN